MNYKMIGRFMSRILFLEVIFMLPALLISLCRQEWASVKGFGIGMTITLVAAAFFWLLCRGY